MSPAQNESPKQTKVLGFDNWTKGAHHYQRLLDAFAARNMTLQLVHIGSWGNDPDRPLVEMMGNLPVRDIKSYPGGSFEQVLDTERPDVVILLSTMTFAHRAFIRYCRVRGIPTLNLYHGMTTTWFDIDAKTGFTASPLGHARFVLHRLAKTIRDTLPCYTKALIRTGASRADWLRFFQDVAMMLVGRHILVASDDARTDLCAVYTESEVEHAEYTYRFSREQVHVVGNPDLVRFGVLPRHICSGMNAPVSPPGSVMYIDTALQPSAILFPNIDAFAAHLREAADSLSKAGFRLLLKLHPANDIDGLKRRLVGTEIDFVETRDFVRKLESCCAAIVETTTLAMIPALFGLPLLLANFGVLSTLKFGSALTSYPRARFLTSLADFPAVLLDIGRVSDVPKLQRWIARSSGPLPAEDMPLRVAEVVAGLAPGTPQGQRKKLPGTHSASEAVAIPHEQTW